MKKFHTAFWICGVMTMLTSCSKNDNEVVPSVLPEEPEEYVIEVGEGMSMPENMFLTVPATTDCDLSVINALKAINKVTDVKAFKLNTGYDSQNEQYVTKTAYYFNYKQLVDHNDPTKGWFKQQCVLSVAGKNRPTVLHTQGYALNMNNKNDLQMIGEPSLVPVLEANCLQVEYRYFGWSLPEGYTNKWNYLNCKQHSDDLHAIVTAIKKSGVVGNGKWLATGVSKSGMTSADYAYYYPNEMEAYVPFCTPFHLSFDDKRPYSYILTKEAFDGDTEKLEKVKAAFINLFSDKKLQLECAKMYRELHPSMNFSNDEEVIQSMKMTTFTNYFLRMQYVPFDSWESIIPKAGDSAEDYYFDFIMADEKTQYPGALTRAISIARDDPNLVQLCKEQGYYCVDLSWVEHLLTAAEKEYLSRPLINPATYGVTYDDGKYVKEFLEGMRQSTCHMMYVYGTQDPWTGGQISDDKMGVNSRKLFIRNGTHNDNIDMWNQSEKAELFKWLAQLGFLANSGTGRLEDARKRAGARQAPDKYRTSCPSPSTTEISVDSEGTRVV